MQPLRALIDSFSSRSLGRLRRNHAKARDGAAQEHGRLALAAFLAEPGSVQATWVEGTSTEASSAEGPGLAGTPGTIQAIKGQRLFFLARKAEEAAQQSTEQGGPDSSGADGVKEAYENAANAFFLGLLQYQAIEKYPDYIQNHNTLTRSLLLMILAYCAVKAGREKKRWGRFGDAATIARFAVESTPGEMYLRLRHADILELLKEFEQAMAVLNAARGLAINRAWELALAWKAAEVAISSMKLGLMAQAENAFLRPLESKHRDGEKQDTTENEEAAIERTAFIDFIAGRLCFEQATQILDEPLDLSKGEALNLARKATERFAQAGENWQKLQTRYLESDIRNDTAISWLNASRKWLDASRKLCVELLLMLSRPAEAIQELHQADGPQDVQSAGEIHAWMQRGLPARLAASALISLDPWAERSQIGFRCLAHQLADRIEPAWVAMPAVPSRIVVRVQEPLLTDEKLAYRITGQKPTNSEEPNIVKLREILKKRSGFILPGVQIKSEVASSEPRRISVISVDFDGEEVAALTPPDGDSLLMLDPAHSAGADLEIQGQHAQWIAKKNAPRHSTILHPAFALLAVLEVALKRAIHRLIDVEQTNQILPQLPEENLDQGLLVLRFLLAERMPLSMEGLKEEVVRRLKAGDDAVAVRNHLRALPGLRSSLWGNESWRHQCDIPDSLEARILADHQAAGSWVSELKELLPDINRSVLVTSSAKRRDRLRAAIAASFPDLPVLTKFERGGAP